MNSKEEILEHIEALKEELEELEELGEELEEQNMITYDDLEDEAQREYATADDWNLWFDENHFKGETFACFVLRTLKAVVETASNKRAEEYKQLIADGYIKEE